MSPTASAFGCRTPTPTGSATCRLGSPDLRRPRDRLGQLLPRTGRSGRHGGRQHLAQDRSADLEAAVSAADSGSRGGRQQCARVPQHDPREVLRHAVGADAGPSKWGSRCSRAASCTYPGGCRGIQERRAAVVLHPRRVPGAGGRAAARAGRVGDRQRETFTATLLSDPDSILGGNAGFQPAARSREPTARFSSPTSCFAGVTDTEAD